MKKSIKYMSILSLFALLISSICFATSIDMNLDSTTGSENLISNNIYTPSTANASNYTTISGSSSNQSNNEIFTFTNIINIFIVVVGIVLILLGLAILVRLKY